jgi:4'-phosphopantetheinyl transferase EntD
MRPLLPNTVLFQHAFVRDAGLHTATFCVSRCSHERVEGACRQFLAAAEEAVWRNFAFPRRQRSYLLGRYCAKEAVACQASLSELKGFEIGSGVFQQPVVRGAGRAGIQVSISHSDTWAAALAFDESHPMGLDMEQVHPERSDTIRSQLTTSELAVVAASPLRVDAALTLAWSVKEALSKTLKTGLTTPLQVFELSACSWEASALACEFTSFGQYRALGLLVSEFAIGLVLPRRSQLGCSLEAFRSRFDELG